MRLSPERFGVKLMEIREVAARLMQDAHVDYLDMSIWDVRKEPEEAAHAGRSLMSWFTDLDRGDTRLGVAGKVAQPADAHHCLDHGADFVLIGRAAVLHHDWPTRALADTNFQPIATPVSADYLHAEGLGPAMVTYMRRWKNFVID